MSIRDAIVVQARSVARQQDRPLAALSDETPLLETGLDSLCIAILVANLEDELGLDPFGSDSVRIPVTFGDFVRLYEMAAA